MMISRRSRVRLAAWVVGLLAFPAAINATNITLFADLSGAQEVPPVTGAGVGSASLLYDDVTGLLTFAILFADLSGDLTAAHFHEAPAGAAGGVAIDIAPALPGGTLPAGTSGLLTGTVAVAPSLEFDLLDEGLYINLHTALNPGGEIRGQVQNATTQIPPVPEPAAGLMLLLAAAGFRSAAQRRS